MSRLIKVLGTGCPKCQQLTALVEEVVSENQLDAKIEKVEEIADIMKYNVMTTPALVVDEQVKLKGRIPAKSELLEMLKA